MGNTVIKALLVEDNVLLRKDLTSMIAQWPDFMVVGQCGSVAEAAVLLGTTEPDVLLLDISLRGGTGFDVLENTPRVPPIIFLTGDPQHALKAIKFGAVDYLLKPIDVLELKAALEKVKPISDTLTLSTQTVIPSQMPGDHLLVKGQHFVQVIEWQHIMYGHSNGGYTTFFLVDGRSVLTSKYLKEYEAIIPLHRFFRSHQSYLVNRQFVEGYHREGHLRLKNGVTIPVSVRRRDEVLSWLTCAH